MPNLTSPDFYLKDAARDILEEVIDRTGSNCGFIAYNYESELLQLRVSAAMIKGDQDLIALEEDDHQFQALEDRVGPGSVLAALFLQSHSRLDPYYISDLDAPPSENGSEIQIAYKPMDEEARSMLLCPIRSDGNAVGLLVITSHNVDTYTKDHGRAIMAAADLAGAAHAELKHRELASKGIEPYLYWGQDLFELMNKNRDLALLEMSYILYEVDYIEGRLKAHYDADLYPPGPEVEPFEYTFESNSLAANTLRKQASIFITDVNEELESPHCQLAEEGIIRFNIKGGVYSLPIRVEGRISAILVTWSRKGDTRLLKFRARIYRLSHLIVNDPDRDKVQNLDSRCSHRFLDSLNKKLELFDGGKSWKFEDLFDAAFRKNTMDVILNTLTERACDIKRVRLWLFDQSEGFFECIYSYSSESAMGSNVPEINKYLRVNMPAKNIYSKYTINRAESDPFARLQHVSMFGQQDPVSSKLDKDPDGHWFIAPIVSRYGKRPELLGYISADNHCLVNGVPTDRRPSERREVFQRYALNHVADLLVDTLRAMRIIQHRERK